MILKELIIFVKKISKDAAAFKHFSRGKAEQAQAREILTLQPKEALSTASKAKLNITNFLGGTYFFTVDEVIEFDAKLHLIEAKHTKNALLPTKSDIKDGLLKLILYCNFATVRVGAKQFQHLPILKLTSTKLIGSVNSKSDASEIQDFLTKNNFTATRIVLINTLFEEATKNNFLVIIEHAK